MGKTVAVKKSSAVANPLAGKFDTSLQSAGDTLDKNHLRIPKLTLIQGMTKAAFNTGKAPVGSFIDSIEKTNMGESNEIFVMNDTRLWEINYQVKEKGKMVKKYLGTIDYLPENENLRDSPRIPEQLKSKAEKNGVTVSMLSDINEILRFYVLRAQEVIEGIAFPYIVDFKRTSFPAGIQLKNSFFKMRTTQGMPSYAKVFTLGSEFVQGEFDYYIKTVSSGRLITEEEIGAVEKWVKEMNQNKAAYQDDSSEEEHGTEVVEAEAIEVKGREDNPKF